MIWTIIALTVIDAVCTGFGVTQGYIAEGNPIVDALFSWSIPGTCLLAVFWTSALAWWIGRQKFRWVRFALAGIVTIKSAIVMMHAAWLILVF